jgi:hypothetical protein
MAESSSGPATAAQRPPDRPSTHLQHRHRWPETSHDGILVVSDDDDDDDNGNSSDENGEV